MLKPPKNKNELIETLKRELDFKVLDIQSGSPLDISRNIVNTKHREITVIVISNK